MYKLISKITIFIVLLLVSSCSSNRFVNIFYKTEPIAKCKFWTILPKGDLLIATSMPISSTSNSHFRGLHYIMVVYNTKQKYHVISVLGGNNYNSTDNVIVKVNYNEYFLPVSGDRAWLTNINEVQHFLQDLSKGDTITIINNFIDSTQAVDVYSLEGFNDCAKFIMPTTNKNPSAKQQDIDDNIYSLSS